jgi:thiol-disulfide isomerase/thioredoxin
MRRLLAALALAALAALLFFPAGDRNRPAVQQAAAKKGPPQPLKVGDPAPPLTADRWLQGAGVAEFEPGKVYAVDFWAPWSVQSVLTMPSLAGLQSRYREKGLTVVGYSCRDTNNTPEMVAAFVARRGPKLGYTLGFSEGRDSYDAWMTAAGRGGLPCSFVVDRAGKVAYIGHPMFLGEVVPKVVAGTWDPAAGAADVAAAEKELEALYQTLRGSPPDACLKALNEFEARRPGLAGIPQIALPKLKLLFALKKFDEAAKMADAVLAEATARGDPTALQALAGAVEAVPEARAVPGMTDRWLKAAAALLEISADKDPLALTTAAQAYLATGDTKRGKALAGKALEAAGDTPGIRQYIERQLQKYETGGKGEKPAGQKPAGKG